MSGVDTHPRLSAMLFLAILLSLPLLDLIWWAWAHRRLRAMPRKTLWRVLVAAFMLVQFGGYAWFVAARYPGSTLTRDMPIVMVMLLYIWHGFVLPLTLAGTVGLELLNGAIALVGRLWRSVAPSRPLKPQELEPAPATTVSTRRRFLATAAAIPPVLAMGSVGISWKQLSDLRLRRFDIALSDLPDALDGLSIAHVTDHHVGKFTDARRLRQITDATNDLKPDLVLMTGDLIDHELADLPMALDAVKRLESRCGLFMVEGNHDLFEGRERFEQAVLSAGLPLLLNESRTLVVRGHSVQVLGVSWGTSQSRSPTLDVNLPATLARLDKRAFPILLAHHPHAFDDAAAAGIPLTLAGHTHGGQLMATEDLGPGPAMYRYWSGLYRKGESALVVSNGVGNWFPLRINAPAEIVHIVLHRQPA